MTSTLPGESSLESFLGSAATSTAGGGDDAAGDLALTELFAPKKSSILDKIFSAPSLPTSQTTPRTVTSTNSFSTIKDGGSQKPSSTSSSSSSTSSSSTSSSSQEASAGSRSDVGVVAAMLGGEDDDDLGDIELNFDDLDITTEDPDFGELAELIEKFQEDPRMKEVLLQGVDMRTYSLQVEQDLSQLEREGINDLIDASENIVELHEQMEECDSILATMEQLLEKFQNDLGNINTEIKILQDQSSSMSVRVKNRREIGSQVSEFIDQLYIPKELDMLITPPNIHDQYLQSIMLLHDKLKFVTQDKHRNLRCCQDSFKQLERLRLKAVEKIKKFFHEEFRVLRKPQADITQIQLETLLKYKF